jgi:hypothetical protein
MSDDKCDSGQEKSTDVVTFVWNLNGQSWHGGRTSDGTPTIDGSTDVPRLTVPAFLFGVGSTVLLPPAILYACSADGFTIAFLTMLCLPLWIACAVTGTQCLLVRNRILKLVPASEIARWLNADSASVQNVAVQLSLSPSYIVNGQPFYKANDFGDVVTLLRPSTAPAANLLRSMTAADEELTERLLRPVSE